MGHMRTVSLASCRPIAVIVAIATAGAVVVGCAETATGDPVGSVAEVPTTVATATATTTPPNTVTSAPVGPTPTTPVAPVATTAPPGSPPSAPPSTAPVYQTELVLRRGGIGAMDFGAAPEDVMTYVGSLFGSTTNDSDWVEASEYPDCAGTMVRVVDWGVLSLQFSDNSPYGDAGQHFSGWVYGAVDEIGAAPEGMVTELGLTTGSSVADLKERYPEVEFSEGDPNGAYPDSFFVDDDLWGLLSGPGDEDVVTVLYGGAGCGR